MLYQVVGWIGAITMLVAYFLVAGKRLTTTSRLFHGANLVGGTGVAVSSVVQDAIPAFALNATWAMIALYGLTRSRRAASGGKVGADG
jgi:hypothetical protein